MIYDFHFIRPAWLLALLPLAVLFWNLYRRDQTAHGWQNLIAPHLLPHLLRGQQEKTRIHPLALGWALATLAIAGPTWRREPAPFADDTAALAIVLKVTPSMLTEDIQPSRLARSVQKIHDLLDQRKGAKTCLIAYSGTAHVVMPLTTDAGIIDTFAAALDPKIMPTEGDVPADAIALAEKTLAENSGSILWITDAAPDHLKEKPTLPLRILPMATGPELNALTKSASSLNATLTRPTADDSDITAIARQAKFSTTAGGEKSDRWQESGYWLTPLLALLTLPFFRRGWMLSTGGNS